MRIRRTRPRVRPNDQERLSAEPVLSGRAVPDRTQAERGQLLDEQFVAQSPVFANITFEQANALLLELGARAARYSRGELVMATGSALDDFPVIVSGAVRATMTQGGVRRTIASFKAGESFAEAIPLNMRVMPVDVWAIAATQIIYIPAEKLAAAASPMKDQAETLLDNIMAAMPGKMGILIRNITYLGEPRLQERILAYVRSLPKTGPMGWVNLPITQKEWAEYLRVDEKSLSRKLGEMRREGIIDIDGRRIRVLVPAEKTEDMR